MAINTVIPAGANVTIIEAGQRPTDGTNTLSAIVDEFTSTPEPATAANPWAPFDTEEAIASWADTMLHGCGCDECKAAAKYKAMTAERDAPLRALAEMGPHLTERELRRREFAAYGLQAIPDDECTDMGDYVVWNNYTPDKTLWLGRSGYELREEFEPLEKSAEDLTFRYNRWGHLDKPARVVGLFLTDSSTATEYGVRNGDQYCRQIYASRVGGDSRALTTLPARSVSPTGPITPAQLPRNLRRRLAQHMLSLRYNAGEFSTADFDRRTAQLMAPNFGVTRREAGYYGASELRGELINNYTWRTRRDEMTFIGREIREQDMDGEDFCEWANDAAIHGSAVMGRIVDAWNTTCVAGEEVEIAGCGHIVQEGGTTIVHGGGTVCDSCLEEDYSRPADDDEWYRTDNLYQHSDGELRTYEEDTWNDDDDDDGDGDGDSNCGGRIKDYSTNVLRYHQADSSIVPSQYGDFLMGIELEVVPERRCRAATAAHTVDELCQNYAILKNDGSLDDGGFEIVTAPRGLAEHIKCFTAWTPHPDLRSWDPGCCGMHVHMSSAAFSQATLGKFIEFINHIDNDKLIRRIAGRTPKDPQCQQYCSREGSVFSGNPKAMVGSKDSERYRMVNTQNLSSGEARRLGLTNHDGNGKNINTVELRIFRGTLRKGRLLAQIEFAHAAVMFCRWSSMRELREEHFVAWLRKSAGMYPNLAKWFGVRPNTSTVKVIDKISAEEEV